MLDYLIVIFEYYKTSKPSYLLWNFFISLSLAVATLLIPDRVDFIDLTKGLIDHSVSVMGILVGFSISMFTLLNTASNQNIEEIKKKDTGYRLYNKPVYLFDLLIMSMIYIILSESALLIYNLLFPFFISPDSRFLNIAFCFDVFFILHIILINISTTVNFYFIITKR